MDFIDRIEQMERLDRLMASREGGLAVVYGRRRIGKTRLLLEWSARYGGLDQGREPDDASDGSDPQPPVSPKQATRMLSCRFSGKMSRR